VEKAINSYSQAETSPVSVKEKALSEIVGNSVYVTELRETIEKSAANSDTGVLIQGERGTGKLLFGQHVHRASSRAAAPYIQLRCDSLSDVNVVDDLLGSENSAGYLEAANGGTLCLIDVEELPLAGQKVIASFGCQRTV